MDRARHGRPARGQLADDGVLPAGEEVVLVEAERVDVEHRVPEPIPHQPVHEIDKRGLLHRVERAHAVDDGLRLGRGDGRRLSGLQQQKVAVFKQKLASLLGQDVAAVDRPGRPDLLAAEVHRLDVLPANGQLPDRDELVVAYEDGHYGTGEPVTK